MQLQPNTLFANRYTLIKLIGRGGFSEVWLAQDPWTGLDIAIKVYAPGQGMDSDGLQTFCQELAGVYHLAHPNLLKPSHVDQWENMPYLIMGYCPKGALSKQIGKLSEEQIWRMLHDVASGLAYLHSKDIVHQDIKPDNILIDENGNYRITDFGISTKARTTLRKSVAGSTSGGTMAYMGPERFSAQPAPTKASDIWSLGAMTYELITGDVPFGEIGGGLQKNGAEIPDITQPISPTLARVVRLMLARETWDRPTAETLAAWAANPAAVKLAPTAPATPSHPTARRVATPPPAANAPKAKTRHGWLWSIGITIVAAIIAVVAWNRYELREELREEQAREEIAAAHTEAVNNFDAALRQASTDDIGIDQLDSARNYLERIGHYESNSIYKKYQGEQVWTEKRNELYNKAQELYKDINRKWQNLPAGITKDKAEKKVERIEKIKKRIENL